MKNEGLLKGAESPTSPLAHVQLSSSDLNATPIQATPILHVPAKLAPTSPDTHSRSTSSDRISQPITDVSSAKKIQGQETSTECTTRFNALNIRRLKLQIKDAQDDVSLLNRAASINSVARTSSLALQTQKWRLVAQCAADELFPSFQSRYNIHGPSISTTFPDSDMSNDMNLLNRDAASKHMSENSRFQFEQRANEEDEAFRAEEARLESVIEDGTDEDGHVIDLSMREEQCIALQNLRDSHATATRRKSIDSGLGCAVDSRILTEEDDVAGECSDQINDDRDDEDDARGGNGSEQADDAQRIDTRQGEKDKGLEEQECDMRLMLKMLNIDCEMIGWDCEVEQWKT